MTAEDAIALGASGPTLRGSGVDFDLRRDMPYSGYENFSSRFRSRRKATSSRVTCAGCRNCANRSAIVRQALDGMPEGPIKADAPGVVLPDREKMKTQMEALIYHFKIITEGFAVPPGEVYQAVESPRGEMAISLAMEPPSRIVCTCGRLVWRTYRLCQRCARAAAWRMWWRRSVSIDIVLGEIDRRGDCIFSGIAK